MSFATMQKNHLKKFNTLHDKNIQSKNRRALPQPNKDHLEKRTTYIILNGKN